MNLQPLIDPSFWFKLQPDLLSPTFEKGFFIAFGLMVIIGAIIRIVSRQKRHDKYVRQMFSRIGTMSLSMGLVGLVWLFFSYEMIYLLGARFWFLVWLVGLIIWVVMIVRFVKKDIPARKQEEQHRASANKYLPRKKKK